MTKVRSEEIPTGKEVKWYHGGTMKQVSYTITAGDVSAAKFALPDATKAEFGSVWIERDGIALAPTEYSGTGGANAATETTGTTHAAYTGMTADDKITVTYVELGSDSLTHIATSQGVRTSTSATTLSVAIDGTDKKIQRTMSRETTADITELIYNEKFVGAVLGDTVETSHTVGQDTIKVNRWSDITSGFKKIGALVGKRYVGAKLVKKYILLGCETTKYDGAFPTETYYSRAFSFAVDHMIEAEIYEPAAGA